MAYTSKSKIENFLMTDIDNSFNDQLDGWIAAVTKFINNYTGRPDGFEAAEKTKYYDGNGEREIMIDPFTSLTSVEILDVNSDDVAWTLEEGLDKDYIPQPTNESPMWKIKLVLSSSIGQFYPGPSRVKITGKFGFSNTCPVDVELAATILVGEIIRHGRDGGLTASQSLGDLSTSYEQLNGITLRITDVKQILNNYKILSI